MTDYTATPVLNARFESTSHHEEILDGPAADPYLFNWRDVHGTSLAAEFKAALRKLEGLLYVIWGGQPDYAGELQWDQVENPRCRWGPEQWWQQREDDPPYDIFWNYLETAALGQIYGGSLGCSVPVRSRSGDPAVQFKRSLHSPYFPVGSVERYCGSPGATGHQVHDPAGTYKKFPIWPDAEAVTIRYTRPTELTETVVSAAVVTSLGTYPMSNVSGEIWEATIPAQTQDTWVDWYVRVIFSGSANPRHDPFVAIEGDVETPPTLAGRVDDLEHDRAANAAYAYVQFSHYNPFAGGLPELLDETPPHLTTGLRRGTDYHQFDSSENIQPGLINLVRFILDYIGERFHHNPNQRGADDLCCQSMPIRWRWTGSHRPKLYRDGGKGGASGTAPLHNHPTHGDAGDHEARKSWRGVDYVWRDDGYYENWQYGGDESWLSRPSQLLAEYDPELDAYPIRRPYTYRGLQPGDAIDPVHIRELIDAIDYVISGGLWTYSSVSTTPNTPPGAWGMACGNWVYDYIEEGEEYQDSGHENDGECCESWNGDECVPYTKPTWEECQSNSGKCYMMKGRLHDCEGNFPCPGSTYTFYGDYQALTCQFSAWNPLYSSVPDYYYAGAYFFSVSLRHCLEHCPEDPEGPEVMKYVTNDVRAIFGSSYYLCGPPQCPGGPDANHGNGLTKPRYAHDGTPVGTGPSMGNCFGTLESCAELAPGETIEVDFEEVSAVLNLGFANDWYDAQLCVMDTWMDYEYMSAPGLGIYTYDKTAYLTPQENLDHDCDYVTYIPGQHKQHGGVGTANWPVCLGTAVWVAIDLNLDGNGVPQLRDYDLEIEDPFDECPCATWTGPGACE